ncbi:MAG: 16S rRNA (uracil(1498)-N(3))-methyltransferase [Dysgonamonadaceae bacterium]|jgi:16S rRNA (uracil1498-N3)-methyltransferase|nr:16S rRNA (uracil(1498)-N(3))-methyltransferase [Dysgonamonadaceae bacterium]
MNLFYAPDIIDNQILPEYEAQHALKVLRLGTGSEIDITDGKGMFFKVKITEANPKNCRLEILDQKLQKPLWKGKIEIAVAPTKNIDRIEWFAEKAVEIGIDSIVFLSCRYSERKEIKTERIRKVAISAMKQSLKARLPEISEIIDFKKFINTPFDGQKFIAHCYEGDKPLFQNIFRRNEDTRILIGPEGDFSEEEVRIATAAGYNPVSLCESRLRTETAALFACQAIHILDV